ncbi:MAG TPA: polysaccharide pyruvyl transferase CsaB [bacterium]|nr:polysaccharide pyruvyl transferase CsaB [bacterium]
MSRLVLSGYYGYRNLGDEAILAATLQGLRDRGHDVTVLSSNPKWTAETYQVRAIKRTHPKVSSALLNADLFVQGGGSLIQDATSWRSPLFYLAQLANALIVGTPFMVFAQGIGPIDRGWLHYLVRETLVHAQALTLRDLDSYRWALANLPADLPMALTADPVYLLDPCDDDRLDELLFQHRIEDLPQPWTLVAIKGNPKDKRELYAWGEALNGYAAEQGGSLLLCPFFPGADGPFYDALQPAITGPHLRLPDTLLPAEVLALIGRCAFVIAGRLHPIIMAANRRVPFGAIVYDPKMTAAAAEFGVEPAARRPLIGHRTLMEKLGEAAEDPGWGSRYGRTLPTLQARARENYGVLQAVLEGTLAGSKVTVPLE